MKLDTLLAMRDSVTEVALIEAMMQMFPNGKISELKTALANAMTAGEKNWLCDIQNMAGPERTQEFVKKLGEDFISTVSS